VREVFLPATLNELWSVAADHPDAALLAGGTDLLVKMRSGKDGRPVLIGMERIEELRSIREEADCIHIGAGVTHASLLAHPSIRENFPVLATAVKTLGSPQIRNMGTIGGNICTASPAGDTLPPLYVLGADVEILSSPHSGGGTRTVPVSSFITGPGQTVLKKSEVLAAVRIRKNGTFGVQHFEKVGKRKGMAIAVASLAALLDVSPDGTVRDARFAWGSVGPRIVTSPEVEDFMKGKTMSIEVLARAATLARQAVSPIDDLRATAEYRRSVSGNLLLRLAG
jgi:xanthine dehydrogenase FAD-binding subunit